MVELAIQTRHLSKSYDEKTVLRDINITVSAGEIIGYIGPNGAGKSTTIKILAGLLADFDGSAHVLGYDIRTSALEVKRHIGYIPEHAALYETLTPLEYLRFVGQLHKMEQAGVEKKATELLAVFDLQQHLHARMTTFSKGMRQKVLLVAGLIHNPALIFLDEPLSGLDANAVILVKEILAGLKSAGKTIFYSSHLMDIVEKISDRVIVIDKGTVVADGTFENLKNEAQSKTLEELFTRLTGNGEHQSAAGTFVDILENRR